MADQDTRNDDLSQVDNLEIEPLTDEALEPIAGGADAAGIIRDPCLAISCSGVGCSSTDLNS